MADLTPTKQNPWHRGYRFTQIAIQEWSQLDTLWPPHPTPGMTWSMYEPKRLAWIFHHGDLIDGKRLVTDDMVQLLIDTFGYLSREQPMPDPPQRAQRTSLWPGWIAEAADRLSRSESLSEQTSRSLREELGHNRPTPEQQANYDKKKRKAKKAVPDPPKPPEERTRMIDLTPRKETPDADA